jgi:hypothetical protein
MQEEEKLINATRQLLLAVAESPPVRASNQRATQKLLDHLFTAYSRYANLAVITTNGQEFASGSLNAVERGRAQAAGPGDNVRGFIPVLPSAPTSMTVFGDNLDQDDVFREWCLCFLNQRTARIAFAGASRELWMEVSQTS